MQAARSDVPVWFGDYIDSIARSPALVDPFEFPHDLDAPHHAYRPPIIRSLPILRVHRKQNNRRLLDSLERRRKEYGGRERRRPEHAALQIFHPFTGRSKFRV